MPETQAPIQRATVTGRLGSRSLPRCAVFRDGEPATAPQDLSQISEILKEGDSFVWLDVVDPGPNDLTLLQDEFKLHPLAVEDAVVAHQRPKIEAYGNYWFVVVIGVTRSGGGTLTFHETAIFAGQKFLVTVRDAPPYPLDEIERRWLAYPHDLRRDSGFLLYTILDTVVDGYFPVAEAFEEQINELEERLFGDDGAPNEALKTIFTMKRELQEFRRAAVPLREILNPIIRGDLHLFAAEEIAYYRDVYDHAVRVIDQMDAARDLLNSALDIHLSLNSNRQAEVSRQLTIIATIFLPLTFVTGFFGQNFGVLIEHISGGLAFWVYGIGTEVAALIALLIYFKHKRWF